MNAAARVVLALVAATLLCAVFAIAHGQAVGRVGTVGSLMSPTPSAGGGPAPPDPFGITTEDDQPLTTEADDPLVTEAAP